MFDLICSQFSVYSYSEMFCSIHSYDLLLTFTSQSHIWYLHASIISAIESFLCTGNAKFQLPCFSELNYSMPVQVSNTLQEETCLA